MISIPLVRRKNHKRKENMTTRMRKSKRSKKKEMYETLVRLMPELTGIKIVLA